MTTLSKKKSRSTRKRKASAVPKRTARRSPPAKGPNRIKKVIAQARAFVTETSPVKPIEPADVVNVALAIDDTINLGQTWNIVDKLHSVGRLEVH